MLRQKQQALERRESSTFRRGPRQKGQVIDPHSLSQALTVAAQHLLGQAEQPTPITLAPAVLRPARLSAEADSLEEVADWITPAPVQWATDLGQDRADLGATMAQTLSCHPDVARVDIDEQSGFLLITLTDVARGEAVRDVLRSIPMMPADAAPADHADTATRVERRDAADVQYAHATMCRVIRTAEAAGVPADAGADLSLLTTAAERALLVLLADHTQRLTPDTPSTQAWRYLRDVADAALAWRDPVRPMTEDEPVTRVHEARLLLAVATRVILASGLAFLGWDAPTRM